jgi:hypothetical protein
MRHVTSKLSRSDDTLFACHCHKKAGMPFGIPAHSTIQFVCQPPYGETSRKNAAGFTPGVFV